MLTFPQFTSLDRCPELQTHISNPYLPFPLGCLVGIWNSVYPVSNSIFFSINLSHPHFLHLYKWSIHFSSLSGQNLGSSFSHDCIKSIRKINTSRIQSLLINSMATITTCYLDYYKSSVCIVHCCGYSWLLTTIYYLSLPLHLDWCISHSTWSLLWTCDEIWIKECKKEGMCATSKVDLKIMGMPPAFSFHWPCTTAWRACEPCRHRQWPRTAIFNLRAMVCTLGCCNTF